MVLWEEVFGSLESFLFMTFFKKALLLFCILSLFQVEAPPKKAQSAQVEFTGFEPAGSVQERIIGFSSLPQQIENISQVLEGFLETIKFITATPVPRSMLDKDGKMGGDIELPDGTKFDANEPVPVVRLSEISGNDTRDKGVPATPLVLQLNGLIEGTTQKLFDELHPLMEVMPSINQLLVQAKKANGTEDMVLSDLTGKDEHKAVPVTNLVVNLQGIANQQREDLDALIRLYAKRGAYVLGGGIGLYALYRWFMSSVRARNLRFKAITQCFSLAHKERAWSFGFKRSSAAVMPQAKKVNALVKRLGQKQGGLFALKKSLSGGVDMIAELSKKQSLAVVPGNILKESFVNQSLQKQVITAMHALVIENIPLVVLKADDLRQDEATMQWLRLAFKPNKIVFDCA